MKNSKTFVTGNEWLLGGLSGRVLVTGENNTGKTELVFAIISQLLKNGKKVLFVTDEMSRESVANKLMNSILGDKVSDDKLTRFEYFFSEVKPYIVEDNFKISDGSILDSEPTDDFLNSMAQYDAIICDGVKGDSNVLNHLSLLDVISITHAIKTVYSTWHKRESLGDLTNLVNFEFKTQREDNKYSYTTA